MPLPTVLSQYIGTETLTHTIPLGTPTAGKSIVVIVVAAATLSAPVAPWVRDVYNVSDNGAAVYRLPAASNNGSITSLAVTLNGTRQLAAVVLEDDIDAASIVTGITENTGILSTATTTTTAASRNVALAFFGVGTNSIPPLVTGYTAPFTALADSGAVAVTNEDMRMSVAGAENVAVSGGVTATYTGNFNRAASVGVYSFNRPPAATPTTTTVSANPSSGANASTSVTLSATVSPSNAAGTVQFRDGATPLGSPVTVSAGAASLAPRTFAAGTRQITAQFIPADSNAFATSTSSTLSYAVVATPTATTIAANPSSGANSNTQVTLSATVTPSGAAGTVQFRDGTTALGSPVAVSGGTAALAPRTFAQGTRSLTAEFIPTDNTLFAGSTSSALSYSVSAPTTVTLAIQAVTASGWTNVGGAANPLAALTDASDATYLESQAANQAIVITYAAPGDSGTRDANGTWSFPVPRLSSDAAGSTARFEVVQGTPGPTGGTVIASTTVNVAASPTTPSPLVLTPTQAGNVSNPAQLFARLVDTTTRT